ncbi:MAG TPA: ribonuclease P protein component [Vicinamibacterales bacterium]|nr:ribonuclease P protein component [Vicinamibacterales bacterium]
MASQRFAQTRRLRRRAEFQQVFETGRRAHGRYFTLVAAPNQAGTSRVGIVASKKIGNAVRRNRAKRLIREIFRRSEALSARNGLDVVVIARRELFDAAFDSLEQDFHAVLRRCAGGGARSLAR